MSDGSVDMAKGAGAAEKAKRVRGVVYINLNRCKGCGFCIEFCPPVVLEFSKQFNAQGYHPPRLTDPDGCTGCDLCGLYCPDFAIYAVMTKTKKGQQGRGVSPGSSSGEVACAS